MRFRPKQLFSGLPAAEDHKTVETCFLEAGSDGKATVPYMSSTVAEVFGQLISDTSANDQNTELSVRCRHIGRRRRSRMGAET